MTIEDIDFLDDHSEVDSTLFFLDSSARDRTIFPTPAEYVVQFSEPVKLVIGLDILDATIPATMYVVDAYSDSLTATTLDAPSDAGGGVQSQALLSALLTSCAPLMLAMSTPLVKTLYCRVVDTARAIVHPPPFCAGGSAQFLIVVRKTGDVLAFPTAVALDAAAASPSISSVLTLRKAVVQLQHGNYDISTLMTHVATSLRAISQAALTPMDITFQDFALLSSSSGSVLLQGRYVFVNSTTPFVLDMSTNSSSVEAIMGFDMLPDPAGGVGYASVSVPAGVSFFGSVPTACVPATILSNPFITSSSSAHVIVAPGIANLLGVRYITLRCPEIEQHLYSGMTYGSHSTGLGVFKLPAGNEISNLRFDFVSLVRKPFHPIGRLSRLTLRFEISDGVLYDFKGINTQILIAVKFLAPGKRRNPLVRSILNPDYDADFLRYTLRQTADEAVRTRSLGLLPVSPPYCGREGEGPEGGGEEAGDSSSGEAASALRRREIAQRLLKEQDKYDYPAAETDTRWRTVE